MAEICELPLGLAGGKVFERTIGASCCFTGHREIEPSDRESLGARVSDAIRRLYALGVRNFIAGGARGFDTLASECVLALREKELPDIRLLLAIPCPDQTKNWPIGEALRYERILAASDRAVLLSKTYTRYCMHARNRFMVERSAYCIAYLNRRTGGTAYTVAYAEERGKTILHLGSLS